MKEQVFCWRKVTDFMRLYHKQRLDLVLDVLVSVLPHFVKKCLVEVGKFRWTAVTLMSWLRVMPQPMENKIPHPFERARAGALYTGNVVALELEFTTTGAK